jgi:hypothetical protein
MIPDFSRGSRSPPHLYQPAYPGAPGFADTRFSACFAKSAKFSRRFYPSRLFRSHFSLFTPVAVPRDATGGG